MPQKSWAGLFESRIMLTLDEASRERLLLQNNTNRIIFSCLIKFFFTSNVYYSSKLRRGEQYKQIT